MELRLKELEKEAFGRKQAKEERGKRRKTEPSPKDGMLQEKETMPEKNILIADDDQVILDILKEMIQREGYKVFLASNGKEAVEAIQINPIDLAILDIKMPIMDGIEALEKIKKIDQSIEVLIMTGYADLGTLRQAISDHGAFDYILKPFKRDEILNGIQNALLKRDFDSQKKLREKELEERILQLEKEFHERTHQLRESQIKYRDIVENSNDVIVVVQDGKLKFTNSKAVELTGYSQEELMTMSFLEMVHPEDREMVAERYQRVLQGENLASEQSFRVLRKNGESFRVEPSSINTIWEKRPAMLTVVRDITERKQVEEKIKASLKEKEVLLREIHHRVKNNMQVIISLLRLQSANIKDEQYLDMFKESQGRIKTMSLIHEKLYQSEDLTKIDFNRYVKSLVNDLFRSHGVNTNKVKQKIRIQDVSLTIDHAIPCGLIINELVSNSLKYAFPEERKGAIKVTLRSINEDEIELSLSDDGIGIPEDIDIRHTQSLGLELVRILAEDQLEGKIKLKRARGTTYHIQFKKG